MGCYQLEPSLSSTCGVTLATSSSLPWLVNANAKDSSPGTVSKVWVVVSDDSDARARPRSLYVA